MAEDGSKIHDKNAFRNPATLAARGSFFGAKLPRRKGKPARRLTGFPKISPQARGVMRQRLPLAAAFVEYDLMGHPVC